MSSSQQPSSFFVVFDNGISIIKQQNKQDYFHNKLYFSHIISLMEMYLYDLFVQEISTNRDALVKLAAQDKFKSLSLKIPFLLHNTVEDFIIHTVKNFVWHRLNDVDVLYKNVLGIQFNTNAKILEKIKIRHDIVHRNGFDLHGQEKIISETELVDCMNVISDFVLDIEKKYAAYIQRKT